MSYGNLPRRRLNLRIASFFILSAVVYYFFPFFANLPWFPSNPVDYSETITKIRELQTVLFERYPKSSWAAHRGATLTHLDRLAECMEKNTCGPGELTVILLGSFHFGNSQTGHTSGEDIWAGSLVDILQSHNYTLLYSYKTLEGLEIYKALADYIPLVIWESDSTQECIDLHKMTIEQAEKAKIDGVEYLAPGQKLGCAKRIGYEDGIPMQKVRSFHFWDGQRHPLRGWTLSPYNYTGWPGDVGNYYVGYHLEHCRHVTPVAKHLNRAFILGKRPRYFQEPDFAWPEGIFEDLTNEIGGGFEFVGAAGVKGVDDMPMKGIENLGKMDKDDWNSEVAKSAVMLGVGSPPRSPSPYDALCLGIPFINPIITRDENDPTNTWAWSYITQHNALRELGPPYVYHVWKEDKEGLRNAIQSAIKNPIQPYIPENLKKESVEKRLLALVTHDWTAEAEEYINTQKNEGFANPATGEFLQDGLLF